MGEPPRLWRRLDECEPTAYISAGRGASSSSLSFAFAESHWREISPPWAPAASRHSGRRGRAGGGRRGAARLAVVAGAAPPSEPITSLAKSIAFRFIFCLYLFLNLSLFLNCIYDMFCLLSLLFLFLSVVISRHLRSSVDPFDRETPVGKSVKRQ